MSYCSKLGSKKNNKMGEFMKKIRQIRLFYKAIDVVYITLGGPKNDRPGFELHSQVELQLHPCPTFPNNQSRKRCRLIVNIIEIHNLPAIAKLKIFETLLGGLVGNESSLPNLAWDETELNETEEKFLAGSIEALDWQQAKKELR